jgi:hypothetical protein
MDSRNEHKNDSFARLWTGAEKDKEGQPRRPFHVHDQRYSGWMSVNDRDAATCEEYFALVDCTPDGTEQGQNYKAYLRDRDGKQVGPDEPAGPVVERGNSYTRGTFGWFLTTFGATRVR